MLWAIETAPEIAGRFALGSRLSLERLMPNLSTSAFLLFLTGVSDYLHEQRPNHLLQKTQDVDESWTTPTSPVNLHSARRKCIANVTPSEL